MTERNSDTIVNDSKITDNDDYTISVRTTPFGITFHNRDPITKKPAQRSIFVEHVAKHSPCYNQIIVGSKLIKLQNKNVEGLKCAQIMKMFKTVYSSCVASKAPLKMTLRKPQSKNRSTDFETDCARTIFVDINLFYKVWRTLPSNILLDALLICPHFHSEWISETKTRQIMGMDHKYSRILNDNVFRNLLQWKYQQGLLLTVNKRNNLTFWHRLSQKLITLSDPITYKTNNYNPLQLNVKYYENMLTYKYNVNLNGIQKGIELCEINVNVIKEILYQSNPSLNIYEKKKCARHSSFGDTLSRSLNDAEIDEILDQIDVGYEDDNTNGFQE